jgi:hypothetical protein
VELSNACFATLFGASGAMRDGAIPASRRGRRRLFSADMGLDAGPLREFPREPLQTGRQPRAV